MPSFGKIAKAALAGGIVRGGGGATAAVALIGKSFRDSVSKSWRQATGELEAAYERCPIRRILLAGYSQGAILLRYVAAHLDRKILARIVSVDLFADPTEQRVVDRDLQHPANLDGKLTYRGIDTFAGQIVHAGAFRQTAYPKQIRDRVYQYCVDGDFVCDFSAPNLDPRSALLEAKIHASYAFELTGIVAGRRLGRYGSSLDSTIRISATKREKAKLAGIALGGGTRASRIFTSSVSPTLVGLTADHMT